MGKRFRLLGKCVCCRGPPFVTHTRWGVLLLVLLVLLLLLLLVLSWWPLMTVVGAFVRSLDGSSYLCVCSSPFVRQIKSRRRRRRRSMGSRRDRTTYINDSLALGGRRVYCHHQIEIHLSHLAPGTPSNNTRAN